MDKKTPKGKRPIVSRMEEISIDVSIHRSFCITMDRKALLLAINYFLDDNPIDCEGIEVFSMPDSTYICSLPSESPPSEQIINLVFKWEEENG